MPTEADTLRLGAALAREGELRGFVLHLSGELGSGKTTLVRGLLREAGFKHVRILEGGVDAWAERIDASMARY